MVITNSNSNTKNTWCPYQDVETFDNQWINTWVIVIEKEKKKEIIKKFEQDKDQTKERKNKKIKIYSQGCINLLLQKRLNR